MSEKKEYTVKEIQELKEKYLVVVQDTLIAFQIGMIGIEEFLGMVVVMSSMLHAIYHINGERTWKCGSEDHSNTIAKIDRLYDGIIKDREKGNDLVEWVDNPEKQAELEKARADAEVQKAEEEKKEFLVKGHLH